MFRLVTSTCPRCGDRFQTEADSPDPGREYRCRCPRCYSEFPVGFDDGKASEKPSGWAVPATPAAPAD